MIDHACSVMKRFIIITFHLLLLDVQYFRIRIQEIVPIYFIYETVNSRLGSNNINIA